ncbi:Asp-tRNA(Asn)/Glu-tRNA(Gln) amidotransferase subunit GatA [Christensenellaceae bacterium NSJ-63]|uniref:Glutamyl-tRNA(Gln) amidotransferase subunit A n=2 Tax=Guopingia tenuis TaxID=2763656 RepID=A0A926HWI4_9FIRM|nr:Asp-tRNA(Asn)/Glu-tRNA(Gln) amidotransferase subunit GatA [Guopingia tenuis]
MTATALKAAMEAGELSSREATEAYLTAIEEREKDIRAYLTITPKTALAQADAADKRRGRGEALSPLDGIPGAIKDNICTKNVRTTCASRMLENFVPPYDATVMGKLSGIAMLGKLNMDEFAMGSSTENSFYQITHNPRDLSRVPGGSSGGSAAAVAAGEAAFALGSDTGGSIRQPAAFCGVVGLKPTYGVVSRFGLIAFASSLDQIGTLTRDVRDGALLLNAIAGHDPKDATSVKREYSDFGAQIGREIRGMRVALPKEYFGEGLHPEVKEAVLAAAKKLEGQGAEIVETSMPSLEHALAAYYVISCAEASSNLARFDGVKYGFRAEGYENINELYDKSRSEGFGREVKRRILLGSFVLSAGYYDAYYKKAMQVRTLVKRDFDRILSENDLILSPVAPTAAYKIGEKIDDPLTMYMGDAYTVPVNIAGLPAVSLPCGTDGAGLPVGAQLIGKPFSEAEILRAAYVLEKEAAI